MESNYNCRLQGCRPWREHYWILILLFFCILTSSLVSNSVGHPLRENMDLLDLSYPINNNTLHWITSRPFEMRVIYNGTKSEGGTSFWLQSEDVAFNSHTGTHMDAPCHFAYGRWCVTDIPLEHLVDRPAAVVDVTKECQSNPDYQVTIDDITRHEAKYGKLPDACILLIKTGWSRYWPIKEQYFGSESNDVTQLHFPGIHITTARWLAQNRHLVGIGIEGPSIDAGQSLDKGTHVALYDHNVYGLENLPNLHRLPARGAVLTVLPLKTERASGAPVRIIANLNPSNGASSSTSSHAMSITFPLLLLTRVLTSSLYVA